MAQPVRAKKHLGQHFLNDENIARNTVNALLEKDKTSFIIEVGPGTGVLTQFLINDVENFLAMDVDGESVDYLKTKYPEKKDKIILADFLETDLQKLAGQKFNVVGNFPYNISSQIMFKVLENKNSVDYVVGMFQKEVAMRLAEKPGSKVYGILSVLLQAFYEIDYLFTVHENVFSPPPKVKSAVIRLTRNNVQKLDCDEDLFKKVVKTTFNQRRKTIRNSVRTLFNNNELRHPLLDKRPEQLSVAQFVELTKFVQEQAEL
ncbi:MAG: 16S rRNA (adenine(1518)-N(6)/adenine(1519)-N(6))-dimethyltransferase RsmA [Bacteroidia bacterium]|nr:16S rRNA (adenine(1518)-N(6)/adenine(1519)-N(6))-dimethyltransferase RsmA [Bacteroidia bacterium]